MFKYCFLFFLLIVSFGSIAQEVYLSEEGEVILDANTYLLEGGRVTIIPLASESLNPNDLSQGVDVAPNMNNYNPLDIQRNLNINEYRTPIIDQSGQNVLGSSLGQIFNSGLQRNEQQRQDIADQTNAARNTDLIRGITPQMQSLLEQYALEVDQYLQNSVALAERSARNSKEIQNILKSNRPQHEKQALLNLMRVKSDTRNYEGEIGSKFNAVRAKFWQVESENLPSDKSYAFLDMGATSYHEATKSYHAGDIEEAQSSLEISNTLLDISLGAVPFVSVFKDAYEAYAGKNLVTGEELNTTERVLAGVGLGAGLLTGGMAGGVVKKMLQYLPEIKNLNVWSIFDSAHKLGFSKAVEVGEFISSSSGQVWSRIKATSSAATEYGYKIFQKTGVENIDFPSSGEFARIMPRENAENLLKGEGNFSRIFKDPDSGISINESFITAYDDIKNVVGHENMAKTLSLYDDVNATQLRTLSDNDVIVRFRFRGDIQQSLRKPIETPNNLRSYGFVPGGSTAGGAREWLIDADSVKKGFIEMDSLVIEAIKK